MIRKINKNDISYVNELGSKYDDKFSNHYILIDYIVNPIYENYVFEEDNVIKGFILSTKMYETVEILLVYVDEQYRNFGVATSLINYLENLDGINNIMLEVSKENLSAYYLYKKLGFDHVSIRKGYYAGVDAYVMKKVIE